MSSRLTHLFKWQLHGLPDFLFLTVQTTNVRVLDVGFLVGAEHRNGRIGLWRKDIDECIRVTVQRDGR